MPDSDEGLDDLPVDVDDLDACEPGPITRWDFVRVFCQLAALLILYIAIWLIAHQVNND